MSELRSLTPLALSWLHEPHRPPDADVHSRRIRRSLQREKRWDWPAVFSTNAKKEVWHYVRHGRTPEHEREEVRGLSTVIDKVADIYLSVRSDGGRFFIDDGFACYKGESVGDDLTLFARLKIVG